MATPRNALLYAWCPLLIQETALNANPWILGVAAIIVAFRAKQQERWLLVGVCCALAVAARIHAVLLVPFLLWPLRWKSITAAAFTLAICYAPFWLQGS